MKNLTAPSDVSRVVLITGCSSGIGRATARQLVHTGWTVYATARRLDAIADLEKEGCRGTPCVFVFDTGAA